MAPKAIFTITAGRTGTAWLGEFLTQNLGKPVIHEPLEIDDFGADMPDIRTMRRFNTFGNDAVVQAFWDEKLARIERLPFYAETNHTLAKCGLVENLAASSLRDTSTLIVLRRNLVKQCVSHLVRHDFANVTIAWQWYLHPEYSKRLVTPKPFLPLGQVGMAVWYCYEMAARQKYYAIKYGDALNILEVALEDITQPGGAQSFWEALGGTGTSILPPPKNQNRTQSSPELLEKITAIFNSISFDVDELVTKALHDGFSFDAEEQDHMPILRSVRG